MPRQKDCNFAEDPQAATNQQLKRLECVTRTSHKKAELSVVTIVLPNDYTNARMFVAGELTQDGLEQVKRLFVIDDKNKKRPRLTSVHLPDVESFSLQKHVT